MTTIDTITTKQIEVLRAEAAKHGDTRMVVICDQALGHSIPSLTAQAHIGQMSPAAARLECARVIRDAEAMAD